jgi:2-polyprenyl-3-methyl-5-hydroxy-6-metoxy-1,4-benzoquinol methylase
MGENTFAAGQRPWMERLGNLRNVVRQELVSRQLDRHLPSGPLRVLDVGAGQGTQALRLAARGHAVTAVEPDARMRDAFERAAAALPPEQRARVTLLATDLSGLASVTNPTAYDVVLCHGVLMYLPDSTTAVAALAARVAPGGVLSVVARNGDAMAWRPASRHDWLAALAMLDEVQQAAAEGRDARYRNEIGIDARADSLASLESACTAAGLAVEAWYGIRVASDDVAVDTPMPGEPERSALLEVEDRLGAIDPYRRLGTLLHLLARADPA